MYDRLRERRVLETLQQFLAPLKLPRKLPVKFDQCGAAALRYNPQGPVTICYEYVSEVERLAPRATIDLLPGPITTESALVGPVVQAVLREVAIATFDLLQIPVWGRPDDAADRVAAFTMLQFGPDVAWNTVVGFQWFLSGSAHGPPDFADVRGTALQHYHAAVRAYENAMRGHVLHYHGVRGNVG
jgi:Putative metallopeptidase